MTFKVILYTFKNIWYFEDLKKIEEFILLSKDLFYEESGIKIIQRLLLYLYSTNDVEPESVRSRVSKLISYKKGEEIMTASNPVTCKECGAEVEEKYPDEFQDMESCTCPECGEFLSLYFIEYYFEKCNWAVK